MNVKFAVILQVFIVCVFQPASAQQLDSVFNQGAGSNNFVEQALPLPDGKVLICGFFTEFNGQPANYIARLNEDGTLDPSWKSNVNSWVRHMVMQPDGKVVIGGAFGAVDGVRMYRIARLNPDGSLDRTFQVGTGIDEKLTPNDPNPPYVFWLDCQADGKIVATGSFAKYNGQTAKGIVRLNPNGSLDTTFQMGNGLDSWGRFVKVLPDQSILLTGWLTSYNGFSCNRMVKIKPDGTPDTTFRPFFGDKTSIYSAALLSDGKFLVSGHSKNEQGLFHDHVQLLNPDGSQNMSFQASTDERTESVLIQPDGKIILSGWFTMVNNKPWPRLVRLHADGSIDSSFVAHTDGYVWNTALDSKGRLLIAGGFSVVKGQARRGVARILLNDSTTEVKVARLINPQYQPTGFKTSILSEQGKNYLFQYCDNIREGIWKDLRSEPGNGQAIDFTDSEARNSTMRCYRVRIN